MKQDQGNKYEVVTRGVLREVLQVELRKVRGESKREANKMRQEWKQDLKTETTKLREELHTTEFRLISRMDSMEERLNGNMQKILHTVQQLVDAVIGEHKSFEVESVSIKHNYSQLEERVKKVEKIVFST